MIEILMLACAGVLLQEAEPILHIKRWFGFKEEDYDTKGKTHRFVHRLLYCAMCLTFWFALAITWDLGVAAVASVLAAYIHKKIIE